MNLPRGQAEMCVIRAYSLVPTCCGAFLSDLGPCESNPRLLERS